MQIAILVSNLDFFDFTLKHWPKGLNLPVALVFRQSSGFVDDLRARGITQVIPLDPFVESLVARQPSYAKYTRDADPDVGFACKLSVPLAVPKGTLYMDHDVVLLRDPTPLCTLSFWSWDRLGIVALQDNSPHALRFCEAVREAYQVDFWPVDYNEHATDNGVFYLGHDFEVDAWLEMFDTLTSLPDFAELPPKGMSIKHRGLRLASAFNGVFHKRVVRRPEYVNASFRTPQLSDLRSAVRRSTFLHYAAGKCKYAYLEALAPMLDEVRT